MSKAAASRHARNHPDPTTDHPRAPPCCRHPPFLKIMDEVQQGLRYLFQTDSKYTLCASGTGHAGMEMAIANLLEPGETIVVGNNGIWVRVLLLHHSNKNPCCV